MDAQELGQISLFSDLSEDDLKALATYADEVTVSEGKHLVDEGGYAYDLFVIVEGTAQVIHGGEVVAELGPGDFFGEGAILGDGRRHASIVTTSQAQVLVMFGTEFRRLEQSYPDVAAEIKSAAANRLAAGER